MKQQIARLSPHQNGKVVAVLMAVVSLIVLVPFVLIAALFGIGEARGASLFVVLLVPLVYLVIGYIGVVIGCAIYNVLVPFTGGLEFDAASQSPP